MQDKFDNQLKTELGFLVSSWTNGFHNNEAQTTVFFVPWKRLT